MKILVAMSGGVDSSVVAALLHDQGHDVVGATMKLWGGSSDSGCCSLSDVEDARRVAHQLGISHHVFNFGDDFTKYVVEPYVKVHQKGHTPNPCIECNRHIKFDRFLKRALQLGFDAIATGHHVKLLKDEVNASWKLCRSVDQAKDQSYVLCMLGQEELSRCMFPLGDMTKTEVREYAKKIDLRTATKPDSQDVCFISTGDRSGFLEERMNMHSGKLVDVKTGEKIGDIDAVEMITIGQRKGMGGGTKNRRYAVDVDVENRIVTVGDEEDLFRDTIYFNNIKYSDIPIDIGRDVYVQTSGHGVPHKAKFLGDHIILEIPQRRVAPGQTIVFYNIGLCEYVLGGAIISE